MKYLDDKILIGFDSKTLISSKGLHIYLSFLGQWKFVNTNFSELSDRLFSTFVAVKVSLFNKGMKWESGENPVQYPLL